MSSRPATHVRIGIRDGKCVSIDDVDRGLGCGCTCAACGHRLIARMGEFRTPHFAHAAKSDCQRMGETHLHLAAKQILMDRKEILLPDFRGREYGQRWDKDREYLLVSMLCSPMHKDLLEESREIVTKGDIVRADHVSEEEGLDGIRPDIIFEKGGRKLLVEISVTHATEKEKIHMIRKREFPCIEIDLSKTPRNISMHDLEDMVIGDGPDPAPRKWLSHPKGERMDAEKRHHRKKEFTRRIRTAARKLDVRWSWIGTEVVNQCPINKYDGWYQARMRDCIYCDHHVAHFAPEDEDLHAELAGRKDYGVLYCGCTVEMARESFRKYGRQRF